jgi:ubiquinone/menaquinone biosynthesis C-methylase UbiE
VTQIIESDEEPRTTGLVLHKAVGYDMLLWLVTLGREHAFREQMLRLARLQPGEAVLDVGCGTGTLAIVAKRHVGPAGEVCGVDASPEMISRAQKKAGRAGVAVTFRCAFAQSLPYPDASFTVVLTTVMLHQLPKKARVELANEIHRVLEPGGRVLAIDFSWIAKDRRNFLDHIHRRHGHVDPEETIGLFSDAGLIVAESGPVGMRNLHFVVATAPCRA